MNLFLILLLANVLHEVAQKPHPVFGIPMGMGLLILMLYVMFKNDPPRK